MGILLSLLRRSKNDLSLDSGDLISESRNWYSERYETAIMQRNILLVIVILSLVCILVGVFMVGRIAVSKTVDPFVIEVEEKSGITNVVNPMEVKNLMADEVLRKYFLMQYLRAREGYDPLDFEYNYGTVVRLFSERKVYNEYKAYVHDDTHNPQKIYGAQSRVTLKIRSIQFFDEPRQGAEGRISSQETKVVVRFTLVVKSDPSSDTTSTYNKIATIRFLFKPMEMNTDDRNVNPLGFQISEYRVDDENL